MIIPEGVTLTGVVRKIRKIKDLIQNFNPAQTEATQ
jgi:hypothetical protein